MAEIDDIKAELDAIKVSLRREREARRIAERELEERSREIYLVKQELQQQAVDVTTKQNQVSFLSGLSAEFWAANSLNQILQAFLQKSRSFLGAIEQIYLQTCLTSSQKNRHEIEAVDIISEHSKAQRQEKKQQLLKGLNVNQLVEISAKAENESSLVSCSELNISSGGMCFVVPLYTIKVHRGYALYLFEKEEDIDITKLQTLESSRAILSSSLQKKVASINLHSQQQKLKTASKKLKVTEKKLIHSERMASIGQLSAGIAHEINNPIGFITSNHSVLVEYIEEIKAFLVQLKTMGDKQQQEQLNALWKKADLDFILQDLNEILLSSHKGMHRVKDIVAGLKAFSHVSDSIHSQVDLKQCIEESIKLVWNELKYNCKLVKKLVEVPKINGNLGQLQQVFVNMLVNAKQAFEEQGVITLELSYDEDKVVLSISDNGIGINEENMKKLFTPFFTTKPVGVGTGLGLSISYGILMDHSAEVDVESEEGVGTTFTIYFPTHNHN